MTSDRHWFSSIQVLIWDFDGTLYRTSPESHAAIFEADYRLVMQHTGWNRDKTIMEFNRIYKIKTPSSTEAAALLSGLSVYEAAIECEQYKDRRAFLSYDKKLVSMFEALSRYRHFLFTNGIRGKIIESLAVLGVSPSTFQEIVTPELVKVNKPQPEGFLHILKKTGLPPTSHLMIGDREAVDIEPARALGMKTCLVFSDKKSKVADITLHTVYKFADYARSHS